MPSKTSPLSGRELAALEAKRDLAAELVQSIREMKAGKTQVVLCAATQARERKGLFAKPVRGPSWRRGSHTSHYRPHQSEGAAGCGKQVARGFSQPGARARQA